MTHTPVIVSDIDGIVPPTPLTVTPLLTAEQVAELLNIHPATAYNWKDNGILPYVKIGKKAIRFRWVDIVRIMENGA
jgi:excisionase family DNA binding protein